MIQDDDTDDDTDQIKKIPILKLTNGSITANESDKHLIFYRICQALMYIFCYRINIFINIFNHQLHQPQAEEIVDHSLTLDSIQYGLTIILQHKLNPLHYITEAIANEFVLLCMNHHIINANHIIKDNLYLKKILKPSSISKSNGVMTSMTSMTSSSI